MPYTSFQDNFYGSHKQLASLGGCGLKGWVHGGASFFMERHDVCCKPGMWRVGTTASRAEGFYALMKAIPAVVDDFGNLVAVQ